VPNSYFTERRVAAHYCEHAMHTIQMASEAGGTVGAVAATSRQSPRHLDRG
jgi:hypothetical protein